MPSDIDWPLFCSFVRAALWVSMRDTAAVAGARPAARAAGGTSDSSLQDFNRALAVQATTDQASRFQSLAKSTEAARKQAQDLFRLAAKADDPKEYSQHVAALKDAVEDVQNGSGSFVKSFSKSQNRG